MKSRTSTVHILLILASVLLAATYTTFFLWKASAARGSQITDWDLNRGPEVIVSIFLIGAALSLILWKNKGRYFALLLFGGVIAKFIFWAISTARIKTNAGVESIPDSNWIGNTWIGAGWAEFIALIITGVLLAVDIFLVIAALRRERKQRSLITAPTH